MIRDDEVNRKIARQQLGHYTDEQLRILDYWVEKQELLGDPEKMDTEEKVMLARAADAFEQNDRGDMLDPRTGTPSADMREAYPPDELPEPDRVADPHTTELERLLQEDS